MDLLESDMLGDTCRRYPVFQIYRAEAFRHTFEHLPCATFSAQLQCLVTQRQCRFGLGLLRCQTQTPATVGSLADVLPTQGYDVTNAQSCEAGEKRCRLEHLMLAGEWQRGVSAPHGSEILSWSFPPLQVSEKE